ncbi:hypothetical protein B0H11DRAFT_2222274 [Mycena galericulata]|nr:hypothetical protein B0H11DRAFT_2222274 [Mycena galericulata]
MQGKSIPISNLQTGEHSVNMDWILFYYCLSAPFIAYDASFRLGPSVSHFPDAPALSQEELDEIPELESIEEYEFVTRRVRSKL